MESIFDEPKKKILAPQRFYIGMALCVIYILTSYSTFFFHAGQSSLIFLIPGVIGFAVLSMLVKYLHNFDAKSAIRWTICKMIFSLATPVIFGLEYIFRTLLNKTDHQNFYSTYMHLFSYSFYFVLILGLLFTILQGVALTRIKKDFIGLVKELGIVTAVCIPCVSAYQFMTGVFKALGVHYYNGLWLRLIMHTFTLVPAMLIFVIFYRANEYLREQDKFPTI